ncbi:MAG: hypothetical protein E7323_02615 [Clostridiales bacterium]|nr:hypothetical protein [Clostridiales bacterium]
MKHPDKQNPRICALLLAILLILAFLPAHGETTSPLHLYLGIPFDTGTVEMVTDILAKEKNALFEMNPNGVLTGYACNIEEYGYLFDLSIDFSVPGEAQTGYSFETGEAFTIIPPAIQRIKLRSLQPARITLQEAQERIPADIQQYLNMVEQMTGQYGQPNVQYFKSSRMNGKKYIKYMFEDGKWDSALMQQVIDTDHRLIAYTVWGNVVLELDVDLGVTYEGVCISNIILYYYPADETADFQSIIEVYPIE